MNFQLELPKQRLTDNEFNSFENTLSQKLPEDFRDFLRNNNGGVTPDTHNTIWIDLNDDELDLFVSSFYPVKYGNYTIENALFYQKEHQLIPDYLFPFAGDMGSGVFCIDLKNNYGAIYYVNTEGEGSTPIVIASSFTQFVNKLEPDPHGDF